MLMPVAIVIAGQWMVAMEPTTSGRRNFGLFVCLRAVWDLRRTISRSFCFGVIDKNETLIIYRFKKVKFTGIWLILFYIEAYFI